MNSTTASRIILSLALVLAFANLSHAGSPAGRWRGEWSSVSTSHRGPMRADIRPNGNGTYSARFAGRFLKVIPFVYRVDLVPSAHGSAHFEATKCLGPLLGSYTMQTTFGAQSMNGNFQAAGDHGSIKMHRVSW